MLANNSQGFLEYLDNWYANLPELPLDDLLVDGADRVAVTCVDIIVGFCTDGALSSPRVQSIVAPIAELFKTAHAGGVRHFILPQDAHPADAVEFGAFPVHCLRGTSEADTAPELRALPFADSFTIFEKNSLSAALSTGFPAWVAEHPEVDTYIVTGDCSDLCVYQLAMFLRLDANARNVQRRVVLPAECVDTYDTPLEVASELGLYAHPGDFHHVFSLHHMAANGVEVVKALK
ncbi:cysteine hydrolase family protein [Herpetosiphon geysericola]|uniref:Nicotinamidase n=1 Tax=Herpetosiphon geysericola TaxID=70996 RepID=A0A0P6YZU2_9CHLR|nr:isochorismatase family cysteine hydrolase [Herpetosiphon geysericola]KPL90726.1 nicotinamidase [Herpetosiphon geysericola]